MSLQNQAECLIIKENEKARTKEIEDLQRRIEAFTESENSLKKSIQDLETEICDKNKVDTFSDKLFPFVLIMN